MKPRHIALTIALAGSAALALFGDRYAGPGIAEPVERSAARLVSLPAPRVEAVRVDQSVERPSGADAGAGGKAPQVLALAPRDALLGDSDDQFGKGGQGAAGSGAPFGRQDWTPPPPPLPPAQKTPSPSPPAVPPLPYTFIGKSLSKGIWEIYLARGDRTYVVHDKEVIDGMYRVESIVPPLMTLTYLPLKQIQQLNIGVFD